MFDDSKFWYNFWYNVACLMFVWRNGPPRWFMRPPRWWPSKTYAYWAWSYYVVVDRCPYEDMKWALPDLARYG